MKKIQNPFYKYYNVHFERLRSRVARNSGFIPIDKVDLFIGYVSELKKYDPNDFESFVVKANQIMNEFPKTQH